MSLHEIVAEAAENLTSGNEEKAIEGLDASLTLMLMIAATSVPKNELLRSLMAQVISVAMDRYNMEEARNGNSG
jgi:hypothetical protein